MQDLSQKLTFNVFLEGLLVQILRIFAWLSIGITLCICGILTLESLGFFAEIKISDFLFGTKWTPLFEPRNFGVLPLVSGTILIAGIASFISVPLGLGAAIYLSEYASPKIRGLIKPILEVLAGIPSVVFGYFALIAISPLVGKIFPDTLLFNALSAGFVVGIMTLPMVTSLSDDAFASVPRTLREGGYAMGATKFEVISSILIPAAASGVIASFILAFSRAIGETMAVTLAAGATPNLTLNPLESIQAMTAYIVQVSLGDTPHGTIEYKSIFAVGFVLFLITMTMNLLSQFVLKHLRVKYE